MVALLTAFQGLYHIIALLAMDEGTGVITVSFHYYDLIMHHYINIFNEGMIDTQKLYLAVFYV